MLKINLSDEHDENRKDTEEESLEEPVSESVEDMVHESLSETPEASVHATKGRINLIPVLVLLGVLVVAVLVYFQRNAILGLFGGEEEEIEQAVVLPPPAPSPEPEVVTREPDPTFVALEGIGEVIPVRIWLSSVVIMHDGSYEINGIAFSHESINAMATSLGGRGRITSTHIPKKSKSSETVYNFSINGVLSDITVPEILDIIPTDKLIALADEVKGRSKEYDIIFTSFPKSGETYAEKDLPFVLEGTYEGVKKVIGELCPEESNVKVYRLVINPSSPGRSFDKIKAAFSLRSVPSI